MENFDFSVLIIILPFIFVGGIIDAIAGGGGVITMVGYLLSGVPMHLAYGTSVVSGIFGTGVSSYNYIKEGAYDKNYLPFASIGIVLGSLIGAYLVTITNEATLRTIMIVALPFISILIVLQRKYSNNFKLELNKKQIYISTLFGCFILGLYGGFVGPGVGTFLIIVFSFMGLDILKAGGSAKFVNFIMCIATSIVFFLNGIVNWYLVIPVLLTNLIASQIGSRLAIANGEKIIQPVMLVVAFLLIIKLGIDVL